MAMVSEINYPPTDFPMVDQSHATNRNGSPPASESRSQKRWTYPAQKPVPPNWSIGIDRNSEQCGEKTLSHNINVPPHAALVSVRNINDEFLRAGSRIVGLLKSVLTRQCPAMCLRFRPGGLTHHLPGAVRPRFACIEHSKGLKGRHKLVASMRALSRSWLIQIVSTLRAFCFFGLYDEWRGLKENL